MSRSAKKRVAVIGGGISGVSVARMLREHADVVIYEKNSTIGGLIRCHATAAGLYHEVGGHVFNTKNPAVAAWFWKHFDRDSEFLLRQRNAKIWVGGKVVSYPIENHLYELDAGVCNEAITEIMALRTTNDERSLGEFLQKRFGKTLCELYFYPYNQKMWGSRLDDIPLSWLEGKLPMPTPAEILQANVRRAGEREMVHASFYYPKHGGSQFIISRLAEGQRIICDSPVHGLRFANNRWAVNDDDGYDHVIYCGDIRHLAEICESVAPHVPKAIESLRTRGITNAFCTCDPTDCSWLYIPARDLSANRIIHTGAFAPSNNYGARQTCVVEFPSTVSAAQVKEDIRRLPGNLDLVESHTTADAYVIQDVDTRDLVHAVRSACAPRKLHLLGRFAEWEYYNMDKCIEAASRLADHLKAEWQHAV